MIHVMHCREIAAILDSDRLESLNWVDRIQVKVHLWVCFHCRVLISQIALLKRLTRERMAAMAEPDSAMTARIVARLTANSG